MTITRKSLADTIDEYDAQISNLQDGKRETFQAYREQLADIMGKDAVKVEIEAAKAAIKRRQAIAKKGEDVVVEKDALVDEIFAEISAVRAPRATRVENIEQNTAVTGERHSREQITATEVAADTAEPSGLTSSDPQRSVGSTREGERLDGSVTNSLSPTPGENDRGESDPAPSVGAIQPETANETLEQPVQRPADPPRSEVAARKDASLAAPEPSNVTPFVAKPWHGTINSKGLKRLPGCLNPEACAGSAKALCFSCSVKAAHAEGEIEHRGKVG